MLLHGDLEKGQNGGGDAFQGSHTGGEFFEHEQLVDDFERGRGSLLNGINNDSGYVLMESDY